MRSLCHRVETLGDDVRWSRNDEVVVKGVVSGIEPFSFVLFEGDRLWIEGRADG